MEENIIKNAQFKKFSFEDEGSEVKKTTNYDQFKGIIGNRNVREKHVIDLMKSLAENNMLKNNPILVNKNMEVIDGQHRLLAAKNLSLPVYYMVMDEAGLEEVQRLNTYAKKWTSEDFLESYIALGKPKYIQFKQYLEDYHLSIEAGLMFLFGDRKRDIYRCFQSGELTFTSKQMEVAISCGEIYTNLRPHFSRWGSGARGTYLYRSIYIIQQKGLGERLIEKARISGKRLEQQHSVRDYMRHFEDILNWNQKTHEVRLY